MHQLFIAKTLVKRDALVLRGTKLRDRYAKKIPKITCSLTNSWGHATNGG